MCVIEVIKWHPLFLFKHWGKCLFHHLYAIDLQVHSTVPLQEQAKSTLKTNYFGILNVCNAMFPILRPHSRLIQFFFSAVEKHANSEFFLHSVQLEPLYNNEVCITKHFYKKGKQLFAFFVFKVELFH